MAARTANPANAGGGVAGGYGEGTDDGYFATAAPWYPALDIADGDDGYGLEGWINSDGTMTAIPRTVSTASGIDGGYTDGSGNDGVTDPGNGANYGDTRYAAGSFAASAAFPGTTGVIYWRCSWGSCTAYATREFTRSLGDGGGDALAIGAGFIVACGALASALAKFSPPQGATFGVVCPIVVTVYALTGYLTAIDAANKNRCLTLKTSNYWQFATLFAYWSQSNSKHCKG